ncbi:unnamed protein product [Blepharisma stoltei]|uniref:Uncharacterized protein n=1 Tax=Blepharisma stoltei TaxID=1481888 RepID=A0AAU9JTX8_9CILI|nr:unnamed protein product [Blepharisma stoltei]
MSNAKEVEKMCRDIDRKTGNVDECLKVIKESIAKRVPGLNMLYKNYKQYWILVYECGLELESIEDAMNINEKDRVNYILSAKPSKFEKWAKLLDIADVIEYIESQSKNYLILLNKLPKTDQYDSAVQDSLLKTLIFHPHPEEFAKSPIKLHKLPNEESLSKMRLENMQVLLAISEPIITANLLDFYNKTAQNHYFEDYIISNYHDLGTALVQNQTENLLETLEYTVSLDNIQVILHILSHYSIELSSKCFYFAAKNALIEYMAPPCISQRLLPYEMESCLDAMNSDELSELKKFIFSKMLSIDSQNSMGKLIQSRGVDCFMELELSEFKLKWIKKLNEDQQIEMLHAKKIEDAIEVVGAFHASLEKQKNLMS